MDIVHRLPPLVGIYEVVKFLDPRLLQIQFYKNESMFSYSSHYVEGHDIYGNLIYNMIKKNGRRYYLLLSQMDTYYYLTFVEEEDKGKYTSVFAGKDMESAVFQYLEEVTQYGD